MITGEHAVVYGHRAIVAAIAQRVHVSLQPRNDRLVHLASDIAEPLTATLAALPQGGPYRFALAAIAAHQTALPSGFNLTIRSEIDPTLGLGSSAAVTIACLGALARFISIGVSNLHHRAFALIQQVQGRGSGADLAASFSGGLLAYRAPAAAAAEITPLPELPCQVNLRYSGYKTPTAEVLQQVADRMKGHEAQFQALYAEMGQCAESAIAAALARAWPPFYAALNSYQALMATLGVSDPTLDSLVAQARAAPKSLAAKISGSGLGDCVLSLGPAPAGFVSVHLAKEGLRFDD